MSDEQPFDLADLILDAGDALPEHHIALPGGTWRMWRWSALRGAGFPARQLLRFGSPELARAADALVGAQAADAAATAAVVAALRLALNATAPERDAPKETKKAFEARRNAFWKLVKLVETASATDLPPLPDVAPELADALRASRAARGNAETALQAAFDSANRQTLVGARAFAADDRFREAVAWQNRRVVRNDIETLLRQDDLHGGQNVAQRRREETVALYAQRYCGKNDMIGFFGPLAWSWADADTPVLDVTPGPRLLAERTVFFEEWGVETLARVLAQQFGLYPWIAPRRLATLRLDAAQVHMPLGDKIPLPPEALLALRQSDGTRLAHDIATTLRQHYPAQCPTDEAAYQVLHTLRERGLVQWAFDIPVEMRAERTLARLLGRVGDPARRAAALAVLAEYEDARAQVSAAAGDAARLMDALDELDATFTRLTGAAAQRKAGQMYAGRTLVYEDCRRDLQVNLGADVLERLGPPLGLLLTSARWFTAMVARRCRERFEQVYAELSANDQPVSLVTFWLRVQPFLLNGDTSLIDDLVPEVHRRWMELLAFDQRERRVHYRADDLVWDVEAAFDAPGPGWPDAIYHSPDVLIAAPDVAAITAGDYTLVLGELHAAMNTISGASMPAQHPFAEDLFMAFEQDHPEPRLVLITPRSTEGTTSRTRTSFFSMKDYRLISVDTSGAFSQQVIPIGEAAVERRDGRLVVTARGLAFDIIHPFSLMLSGLTARGFSYLPALPHRPRITIDNLVIAREGWRIPAGDIAWAHEKDPLRRMQAARIWAQQHGMPERVFVKSPVETKPTYLAFDSLTYVALMAKLIRRTIEQGAPDMLLAITEMLPDIGETWLPDAEQNQYTSEFRIVVVDPLKPE